MANKKITQLPVVSSVEGTDAYEIASGGISYQTSPIQQLDYIEDNIEVDLMNNVTSVLEEKNGGTNNSSYTEGDLLIANAANRLVKVKLVGEDGIIINADYPGGTVTIREEVANPDLQTIYDNSGDGNIALDANKHFTLSGTGAGFRTPPMTNVQFQAIPSPPSGLQGWATTQNRFIYNEGTPLSPVYKFVANTADITVQSVFGRTGIITAQTGDYTVSQVTGAAPLASPTFTGVPAAPTAPPGTNTTQLANTAFVTSSVAAGVTSFNTRTGAVVSMSGDYSVGQVTGAAPLASPTFTGTVTEPALNVTNNTNQIALGTTNTTTITQATLTGSRTFTLPNANSNPVVPSSAPSNNFATGISSSGVISYAQPSFSNISGTLGISQGGTGQTTANSAFNALVPSQATNANKFLRTNGTDTSWFLTTNTISLTDTTDFLTTTVNGVTTSSGVKVCPSQKGGYTYLNNFDNLAEYILLVAPSGNAIGSYNLQLVDVNNNVLGITFNVCGCTKAGFNTSSIQIVNVVDSLGVITANNISNYLLFRGFYRSNMVTPYFIITFSMPYSLPYANPIVINTYQYGSFFLNENFTITLGIGQDISSIISTLPADLVFKMKVFSANVTASNPQGYVYLPASGSGFIYQWSINPSTGALTALSPATVTLAGAYKVGITKLRNYLYCVTGSDTTLYQFRINDTNGTLSPLSPASVATSNTATCVVVDPTDRFVYVCGFGTGQFSQYTITKSTGQLVPIASPPTAGLGMQDLAVHPSGKYLYAINNLNATLYQYSINNITGALTALPTPTIATGSGPIVIIVHPSGLFAYVANHSTNTISQYSINVSTGQLTALSPATFTAGSGVFGLAISNNGRFIFYGCEGAGTINQSTINLTTGLIGTPTTSQVLLGARDCCVDYTSNFLYVYGNTLNQVTPLTINQTTGAITLGTAVSAGINSIGIGVV